jgi:hypothetical protein
MRSESGSVIFYILIAIVLFAALSFAVSQSMRGGSNMDAERLRLSVTEILQYADSLKQAVQKVKIEGSDDAELSFVNTTIAGYTNAACTAAACKIFDASGGGAIYDVPDEAWLDLTLAGPPARIGQWYFTTACVAGAGEGVAGCDTDTVENEELIAVLPFVQKNLCVAINARLGVPNPSGNPPVDASDSFQTAAPFTGTFTETEEIDLSSGYLSACFQGSGAPLANAYHYYRVLVAH